MKSLSARLLFLTIIFVMLAEVLIFVPSVARFRESWMAEKLAAAHLAILTLDATPDRRLGEMLRDELLRQVGAYALFIRREGARLFIATDMPPPVNSMVDLRDANAAMLMMDAFKALAATENRVIQLIGASPKNKSVIIEIIMDEAPLHQALREFAWRIFGLSLVISLFAATLVYLSLQWMLVRPMRRITEHITAFRSAPEDATRVIDASQRQDEIGIAERELAAMQHGLRAALRQKRHLAALGSAVAKVNHDLRGILSSALLISDSLENAKEPEVRRVAPRLIVSIERAVKLCSDTLDFVSGKTQAIEPAEFELRALIGEIIDLLHVPDKATVRCINAVDAGISLRADRELLYRAFGNLIRNAVEAGAQKVTATATTGKNAIIIDIADDGPGLPQKARDNIFLPFETSARAGGTGLGLAIAKEAAHLHGGDLTLMETGVNGTIFRFEIPQP